MAQLGGKSIRTLVTSLELLSDDSEHVLMIDSADSYGGGGVKFRLRRPWDATWGSTYPTFTVHKADAAIVAKIVGNTDAQYDRTHLDEIDSSDFRRDDPNPPEDAQAKADEEARCTELDIERARAANIQQEFILDHSRDRHVGAEVTGCPTCEGSRTYYASRGEEIMAGYDGPANGIVGDDDTRDLDSGSDIDGLETHPGINDDKEE